MRKEKLKSSCLSLSFVVGLPLMCFSSKIFKYKRDDSDYVVSFILSSLGYIESMKACWNVSNNW